MAQAEKDLGNVRGPQGEKGLTGDQGPRGETGIQGPVGPAAGFGTITATIDGGNGVPSVEASWDGEDTQKNVTISFHNLVGPKGDRGEEGPAGPKGDPGDWTPSSDTSHVVLGDGTVISLDDLVEQIRTKLGAPTTSKGGLVTLPADPNA